MATTNLDDIIQEIKIAKRRGDKQIEIDSKILGKNVKKFQSRLKSEGMNYEVISKCPIPTDAERQAFVDQMAKLGHQVDGSLFCPILRKFFIITL